MAEKTGFLGGLRGMIFEEENSQPKPSNESQPIVSAVPTSTVVPVYTGSLSRSVNPEIKAQLDQVVAEANQVSYTEFTNYLSAMSDALAGMDEATRYRAALAAAAKKGFTSQEIVKGLDAILRVLQVEEKNFNNAASQRISERVGAREGEVADIERKITENNDKISRLQAENQQLAARKVEVSSEIQTERQRVEDRKNDFASTVSVETARYEEEKRKVVAYSGRGV